MTTHVENLIAVLSSMKIAKKRLDTRLSELEKEKGNIYHIIEYVPMDCVKMVKATKALRECLRERRQVKEELIPINNSFMLIDKDFCSKIGKQKGDGEKRKARYTAESHAAVNKLGVFE